MTTGKSKRTKNLRFSALFSSKIKFNHNYLSKTTFLDILSTRIKTTSYRSKSGLKKSGISAFSDEKPKTLFLWARKVDGICGICGRHFF